MKDLKTQYEIKQKLGSGSFGKVFLALNKKDSTIHVAVKKISKTKMSPSEIGSLHNEVSIMQHIDHSNIVKYYETYEEPDTIYLCMELCEGGELNIKKIKSDHARSYEDTCALYLEKVIWALKHCHDQGIMHRDIKPENIMFDSHNKVKLIDFGFAVLC
jgi:calcium-dependent protein kinase